MTAADVLEVLDRLDRAGIEWWIEGGWGIDALLGEESRPHDDLDLAVLRSDVDRLGEVFPEFRRVDHEWWPARFVLRDARGRQLDFHPIAFDEHGCAWQELVDGKRAFRPSEGMNGRGRIGGRDVRCASAELQLRFHDYPDPDDVDWDDMRVLCERLALSPPRAYTRRPGHVDPKRTAARPRLRR
jgi:lincosamide nucleotidyltransferase A/C/D/E